MLGGDNIHPDILLKKLTARQWQDWQEYASVFPVGPEREDYRIAYAVAGLAALWAEKPEEVEASMFMVDWLYDQKDEIDKHLNPSEEQIAKMKRMEERIQSRAMGNNAAAEKSGGLVKPPKASDG